MVTVNIFSFIMSYLSFRIYRLSLIKTQDILFHFLDEIFGIIGGVPKTIIIAYKKAIQYGASIKQIIKAEEAMKC